MSNILRHIQRRNAKRHTCRKCKAKMIYKEGYGWTCSECGWIKIDEVEE